MGEVEYSTATKVYALYGALFNEVVKEVGEGIVIYLLLPLMLIPLLFVALVLVSNLLSRMLILIGLGLVLIL